MALYHHFRTALFGLAVAAAATSAVAQANTEYLGGGFVTLSEECRAHGWNESQQIMLRVQPQGLAGNPQDESQFALFFATGTIAFRVNLEAGERSSGPARPRPISQAIYIWNGPLIPDEPTMVFTEGYRETTRFRQHAGAQQQFFNLVNFNEHPGCTASIVAMVAMNPR